MTAALLVIIAYLIGSISTSTILTRWIAKTDIRRHGSGNAGATNTMRVLGTKWGVLVLVIDALKGVVAIALASGLSHYDAWLPYLCGLAVISGHNWPVFFGFRGGKGIATTIGVFLSVHTVLMPAVVAGIIALVILALTRYVSLASLCFTVLTPVFVGIFGRPILAIVFASLVALFSLYRHQQNIGRLLRGTEHRIFSKM